MVNNGIEQNRSEQQNSRENLIEKIWAIQDQLLDLKVFNPRFNPDKKTDSEIADELEALSEQLKTRKKFLGMK